MPSWARQLLAKAREAAADHPGHTAEQVAAVAATLPEAMGLGAGGVHPRRWLRFLREGVQEVAKALSA
eukprot:4325711-Lingulodinium_polyedra.AAC.1